MLEDNIVINNFDNYVTFFGILIFGSPKMYPFIGSSRWFYVLVKRCVNSVVFVMVTL